MLRFVHESLPGRVIFGEDGLGRLPEEVERLGAKRALVLSTPGHRALGDDAARRLGGLAVGVCPKAVMHVPVEVAKVAREEAERLRADGTVAVGGGSTIGLAKAIALELGLPIIAVPTTYAGSEMTPVFGLTEGGAKRTGRDLKALPKTVIYDPKLTLSLPPELAGPSGLNAIAHCVEALYAKDANPITSMIAEEGIRALGEALPIVVGAPGDLEARTAAQYGAWLAGAALAAVGMALHHKLCHTLGGSFELPHAETHAIVLPHAAAYNKDAAPEAMARVARALDAHDAASALFDLLRRVSPKTALAEIGMRYEDLDRAAELATLAPYDNPRPVTREGVRRLLEDAYHGRRPEG